MQREQISINLEPLTRRFRYESDMTKPKTGAGLSGCNKKHPAHGNYLSGEIQLPPNLITDHQYRLELSLIPSKNSDTDKYWAHPCLLHLTDPNTYQPLNRITRESWRLTFQLDPSLDLMSFGTHSFNISNGSIPLGSKNLMITIIRPLETSKSNGSGVTIQNVLEDRTSRR